MTTTTTAFKRGDLVVCKTFPDGPFGLVRRVAKDGTWADVTWRTGWESWGKRMKTEKLFRVGGEP